MIHSSSDKNFPIETLKDHQNWKLPYFSEHKMNWFIENPYFEDKVLENKNLVILERFY